MPRKRTSASRLARHAAEIAIAAPQVTAVRTARMVLAGATPLAADNREMKRMHEEKTEAFQAGWQAMWNESLRIQQQAALTMMGAWWKPAAVAKLMSPANLQRNALSIMGKGVAPVRNRAVANAKRLGRASKSR